MSRSKTAKPLTTSQVKVALETIKNGNNRFLAYPDRENGSCCERMVSMGYMSDDYPDKPDDVLHRYRLTDVGRQALQLALENNNKRKQK